MPDDCRTFAECKQLLGLGKTIHYRGASSRFDEWDTSEPNEGTYDVWEYDGSGTGELEGPRQPDHDPLTEAQLSAPRASRPGRAAARSRSSYFSTLPLALSGSASTSST